MYFKTLKALSLKLIIFFYLIFYGTIAFAIPITLEGDPVDYSWDSKKATCVDIAAINLLNYLDRQKGNENLIPDGKSIKDQLEDFHKKYDSQFQQKKLVYLI